MTRCTVTFSNRKIHIRAEVHLGIKMKSQEVDQWIRGQYERNLNVKRPQLRVELGFKMHTRL